MVSKSRFSSNEGKIFPAAAAAFGFGRVSSEIGAQKPHIIDILVSFSKITISRKCAPKILFEIF